MTSDDLEAEMDWQEKVGELQPEEVWAVRKVYLLVLAVIFMLGLIFAVVGVRAYSDATQEIHRYAECTADGFCRPEFYVALDDPLINGTMRIDYLPAVDPHFWVIAVTGLANVTVDAQVNYDIRDAPDGCTAFFVDCPDTGYIDWLTNRNQCVLVVDLSTDVPFFFRMVNVPQPLQVTLDGSAANITRYADGLSVNTFPVGTHQLVFTNPACDPCVSAAVDLWVVLILLVLWIAFAVIGWLGKMGILTMFGGLMGILMAFLYFIPCSPTYVWMVILLLAILTLLAGVGLAFSDRESED